MAEHSAAAIEHYSGDLKDPRVDRTRRHKLLDIVVITICAVVGGADDWVSIEEFGNAKLKWFREFLELPNGIPCHDTLGRVFGKLDPDQFHTCFMNWIMAASEATKGQVIAIDGKTLRRSHDKALDKGAIVMVSAWATANHLVLGQVKVDDKSIEITAIPELLRTAVPAPRPCRPVPLRCNCPTAPKQHDTHAHLALCYQTFPDLSTCGVVSTGAGLLGWIECWWKCFGHRRAHYDGIICMRECERLTSR